MPAKGKGELTADIVQNITDQPNSINPAKVRDLLQNISDSALNVVDNQPTATRLGILSAADAAAARGQLGLGQAAQLDIGTGLEVSGNTLNATGGAGLTPIANNRILGNVSGDTAIPGELTGAQVRSAIDFNFWADERVDLTVRTTIDTNDAMPQSEKETIIAGRLSTGGKLAFRPNQTIVTRRNYFLFNTSVDLDFNGTRLIVDTSLPITGMSSVVDTITVPNHGLTHPTNASNAARVTFNPFLPVPGGLTPYRKFFVGVIDEHTLRVATTAANAFNGNYISLTGSHAGDGELATITPELFRFDAGIDNTESGRMLRVADIASVDHVTFVHRGTPRNFTKLTFAAANEAQHWPLRTKIKIASDDLEVWGTGNWRNTEQAHFVVRRDLDENCIYIMRVGRNFGTNVRIGQWRKNRLRMTNGTIEYIPWQVLANDSDTNVIRTTCYESVEITKMRFINAPSATTLHYAPGYKKETDNEVIFTGDRELFPYDPDRILKPVWDYTTDPELIHLPDHNFVTTDTIWFGTDGTYPTHVDPGGGYGTSLAAFRIYYAIRVDKDNFKVARSSALANSGTAISFTSNGVGEITAGRFPDSMFGYTESSVGGDEGVVVGTTSEGCRHHVDTRIFDDRRLDYSGPSYGKVYVGARASGYLSTLFGNHAPSHGTVLAGFAGLNSSAVGIGNRGTGTYQAGSLYNMQFRYQSFNGNGGQRPRCVMGGIIAELVGPGQGTGNSVTLEHDTMVIGQQLGTGSSLILEGKDNSHQEVDNQIWYASNQGGNVIIGANRSLQILRGVSIYPEYWTTGGPSLWQVLTSATNLPRIHFYGLRVYGTGWGTINGASGVHAHSLQGTVHVEPGHVIATAQRNAAPFVDFKNMFDGFAHNFDEIHNHTSGNLTMQPWMKVVGINKGTGSPTSVTLPNVPLAMKFTITDTKGDAGTNNITVSAANLTQITVGTVTGTFFPGARVWQGNATGIVVRLSGSTLVLSRVVGTFVDVTNITSHDSQGVELASAPAASGPSNFTVNINGAASFVIDANYGSATFQFHPEILEYRVVAKS